MDKTQVNLERIRAVDTWEENKHPRADNGQFTSGSGGGSAAQTLKNVANAVTSDAKVGEKGLALLKKMSTAKSSYGEAAAWMAGDFYKGLKEGRSLEDIAKEKKQLIMENSEGQQQAFELKMLEKMVSDVKKADGGGPAAKPAAKSTSAHPMAAEVQKDIEYWNMSQYNGKPTEEQKKATIESMKANYEAAAKKAEKFYTLATQASGIDPATIKEFKEKWEKAKGKADALAQMYK